MQKCFYRVSTKGLVTKDGKILLLLEKKSGLWELPGGGLEYNEDFESCLRREVKEEMGLNVIEMDKKPTYVWTADFDNMNRLLIGFKARLSSVKFKASEECADLKFFSKDELKNLNLHPNIQKFADIFYPKDFVKNERPKFPLGINVFVIKDNKILLGKRKNTYGAGTWGVPGGHLEAGEKINSCAARELLEETGLQANDFEFLNFISETDDKEAHYLQAVFLAKNIQGELILGEPDKCEEWKWFDLENLPGNIFQGHRRQIELYKKNLRFSDY